MFGRKVVCVASLCALWSLLVAGEARAFPGSDNRTGSQYSNNNQNVRVLRAGHQAASPLRRLIQQRYVAYPRGGAHAGRFGNAFMVDTGVVLGPASGVHYCYGAASNGSGWRVLWGDNNYSVRTNGIGADGSLLDPQGSLVGQAEYPYSGWTRSIVGTGSGFMAVWVSGYEDSIWAARLDAAGAPLDSFLVWASDSGQTEPAVAFDGDSTCLVVWMENPNGNYDVYATRVSIGGHVLDPKPIRVAAELSQYELSPTVAFGRGVYLVAWTSMDTNYMTITAKAVRVSADGVVLDTAIFLRHDPAMSQAFPALAFGDTCFLASWSENVDVYAARVSVSGHLIDSAGIQLSNDPTWGEYPSVGFDGTRYLVMWCELDTVSPYRGSLRGRRMTVKGVPLDSGLIRPQLPGYSCMYPSVAADQANFLFAFTAEDTVTNDAGVCCVRISPGGAVLDSGIFLPLSPDVQSGPSGASNGTDFLAAWLETADQGSAISAARIRADGTVLDPVGFPVNEAPGQKSSLATGFGDSLYLVAWADYRGANGPDIYCARVRQDGQVLDPNGIVVCNESLDQDMPDISFDGQNFLVVWQDYRSGMNDNIYAARVSPAGVVLDPGGFVVAAADTFSDMQPAACFTGTDHLVVWQGLINHTGNKNIYGALVSPAGAVTRQRFLLGGTASTYQIEPSAARGSANSLVAWVDRNGGSSARTVYAARVRADGTVLDPNGMFIDSAGYDADPLPRVTANAAGYKVLWRRYDYFGGTTHFAVAQVDTAGNVVRKGDWFGLPGSDNGFDAVYGSGPDLLLLFSCFTDTAHGRYYGTDRLWGNLGLVPGVQETDTRQLRNLTGGATVVRGILFLPEASSRKPQAASSLLDISGRKVMGLRPGANDVSRLSPGVYFVREEPQAAGPSPQAVRKVVIAR